MFRLSSNFRCQKLLGTILKERKDFARNNATITLYYFLLIIHETRCLLNYSFLICTTIVHNTPGAKGCLCEPWRGPAWDPHRIQGKKGPDSFFFESIFSVSKNHTSKLKGTTYFGGRVIVLGPKVVSYAITSNMETFRLWFYIFCCHMLCFSKYNYWTALRFWSIRIKFNLFW